MAMVEKLTAKDRDELIDLIDLVFSQAHCPHDFEQLLPKLYGPQADTMKYHYGVRENGKLVAAVLSYPYEIDVNGKLLKMAGIGSVSAHRNTRGKGYMKAIMNTVVKDLQEDGTDLSWLGGQRQRYQYFGYDLCSRDYEFEVSKTNLRHIRGKDYQPAYHFIPFGEGTEGQKLAAFALHNIQLVHAVRDFDEFEEILKSWNQKAYLVFQGEDMVGYLAAGEDLKNGERCMNVSECVLAPAGEIQEAVFSLIKHFHLDLVTVTVSENQPEYLRQLGRICEGYHCEFSGNYRIFHIRKVVEAFLKAKAERQKLMDGSFCVQAGEEVFTITVENGAVTVEAGGTPEISMSAMESNHFFFGMGTPEFCREEAVEYPFLQNWFPLQFGISHQDGV